MRIAIVNMTGGGMCGGYRKYLRNIIPRMAANRAVEALLCASPKSLHVQDWFEPIENVKFVNCKAFPFLLHRVDKGLKKQLKKFLPDVIFAPVDRFFRFNEIPIVNMVQNMEPFVPCSEEDPLSERVRQSIQIIDGKRSIRKSDRVIAISKFVRDFLINNWNIPKEKIGLVCHGIDIGGDGDVRQPSTVTASRDSQFIFTAGSIRPARGLEDLLFAIKQLSTERQKKLNLVIAGDVSPRMAGYQKKLKNWIKRHKLSSKVCWAGHLNEAEMNWCYRNCDAFIMTSRVEACPNIALEAMSHGCICVSSNNPPLPEIFGSVAIYYPPKDGKTLAKQIQTVLSWDENRLGEASREAKKHGNKFSWDVCTKKTMVELRNITLAESEKNDVSFFIKKHQ